MTDSQNTFWPQSGDYVLDHVGELGFDVAWLLLQEARRFGSLDLNLPEDFMYSVVTKACFWSELPDLSFHLLTSFNCSTFPACMERGNWVPATHNNGAVDRADFWFWDAVHDKAPRLTSLITDRLYNTHLLPYHQLTTLKITRLNAIDWQHLLLTLSISPCLRSLSILECYDPLDGEVFRPVVSTSLQHLSIEIWPVLRNLPAMFAFLHLPSLRSLQFRMLGSTHANEPFPCALPPSWPCRPLLAILGSCSASLSQLSVKSEDYTISSEAMGRVLLGVPNLEFLEVNLIGTAQKIFVGEFVARLTPRDDRAPGESVMVPKLRKLFVHEAQAGLRGSPFVPVAESIVRMAEARLRGESAVPLHTVCLSHGCERYTWDGPENLVEELGAPLVGRLEILEATGTLCRVEWL
ncbi:hypothetical protein VNI00_003658 [Paramarasmius palmivorus]|uniref:F-box domain-containing protein n=1 Tax=Paramarasmius palmivorus TaxID=297713 RepID=A0AAW0DS91_9AGAR